MILPPDTPTVNFTVQDLVDLVVTKTADVTTVNENGTINYTITVTNNGPPRVTNVSVTDLLPANVTVVGTTPSQGSVTP